METFSEHIKNKCTIFNTLVELTFPKVDVGSVDVVVGEERDYHIKDVFHDEEGKIKEDDVIIYYDWMDDELDPGRTHRGGPQTDKFNEMMDSFFRDLPGEQVDEQDGSGGGLYYGGIVLREE